MVLFYLIEILIMIFENVINVLSTYLFVKTLKKDPAGDAAYYFIMVRAEMSTKFSRAFFVGCSVSGEAP